MLWTHRKTLLASQFLLLPFHQPSTTPQLSPKTRKTWPGRLVAASDLARNSNPTASAHPMSLPSVFHPGMSRHALHWLPITTLIPKPELASENAPLSVTMAGPGMERETVGELSLVNDTGMETRPGFCTGYSWVRVRVPVLRPDENPDPLTWVAGYWPT